MSKETTVFSKTPKHIAIIMDGNGRWAKQRLKPRVFGHNAGLKAVRRVINACNKFGVKYLTLFAFSSENWSRPKDEVDYLMTLFLQTLDKEIEELHEKGIRLNVLGDVSALNSELVKKIDRAHDLTKQNDTLILNLAINYGGRWDIVQACQKIASRVASGLIDAKDIDENLINYSLTTQSMPDPELLIRTSNEFRLSNFLLWQCAYSEFYFTEKLWPEFDEELLQEAIQQFNLRERRFGKTGEQINNSEL